MRLPTAPNTAPTTTMKETAMLSNLYRRFTIWLGRQDIIFRYLGWNHKRVHRKRGKEYMRKSYPWKGQDD